MPVFNATALSAEVQKQLHKMGYFSVDEMTFRADAPGIMAFVTIWPQQPKVSGHLTRIAEELADDELFSESYQTHYSSEAEFNAAVQLIANEGFARLDEHVRGGTVKFRQYGDTNPENIPVS